MTKQQCQAQLKSNEQIVFKLIRAADFYYCPNAVDYTPYYPETL
jgi:hypothetical protein